MVAKGLRMGKVGGKQDEVGSKRTEDREGWRKAGGGWRENK